MFNFKFNLDKNILNHVSTSTLGIPISIKGIFLICLGSLIVIFFPIVWVIIGFPLITISLALGMAAVPENCYRFLNRFINIPNFNSLIKTILSLMNLYDLLPIFTKLYLIIFYTTPQTYYNIRNFCYGLTILNILVSRYYFYHKIILHQVFSYSELTLITFLIFISYLGIYLRMAINSSIILTFLIKVYMPQLSHPVLRVEPPDLPPGKSSKTFNLFNLNNSNHHHNHNHHYAPKNINWARCGLAVACLSLCISGATYYHVSQQTLEARRQTLQLTRQADATEVAAGTMTKEEFHKRNPR